VNRRDAVRLGIALGLLVVVIVPVAILSASSGDAERANLIVERSGEQLTISLEDPGVNTTATSHGRREVELECLDAGGRVTVSAKHPWPFVDDGGVGAGRPHVHQSAPGGVGAVSRCRLVDTDPRLEGDLRTPS
jgi:hypothetical protein